MEPNVPTAIAAGNAVSSDDEVNSAKNAAAVAARVAASRGPGWTRSSSWWRLLDALMLVAAHPAGG
jgi:hypothetical protein